MMRQFRVVTKPAVVSLLKSQIRRMEDRVSRYQLIIGKVQSNFSQHGAIQTTITILKTNIRATCVQKVGSVVPVVQELRPVEVEKRAIFRLRCQFMSKLSITVLVPFLEHLLALNPFLIKISYQTWYHFLIFSMLFQEKI